MTVEKELWQKILTRLETEVRTFEFDVWIKTMEPLRIMDGKLILCAPNTRCRDRVISEFLNLIIAAMTAVNPLMTDVVVIDPSERDAFNLKEETFVIQEPELPAKIEPTVLNPKYNFENFVVGKSNKFAHAAAKAVADEPGVRYNPLFIYGGAGLGKTHIMHAIGISLRISHPHLKVLYVPSEKFVNDYISSVRAKKDDSNALFREKYRGVDVLMIDDIQFVAGKGQSQEEVFHTFNALHQADKQLVLSSDRPPKEILDIDERLRSRFEWGMMADIKPPDLETRVAILQKKAQLEKYNIPFEVLTFMAEQEFGNVREMESLLNKVIFHSRLFAVEPSVETVKKALEDYADRSEEAVSAGWVIDCTAKYFNIEKADLCGLSRKREIVEPRQICIYVISELLSLPLASIGAMFSNRDHTTVMHARDKVSSAVQNNIKIKVAVNDIKEMVLRRKQP
jgi:chromosomal replication initiator protein